MNLRRRRVIVAGMGLLGVQCFGQAQPAATLRRVGMLGLASEAANAGTRAAFKQGMHDLGWVEGRDIEYRIVYAEGDMNRLDALARDLVALNVDVIVAGAALPTRAVQNATKTIPIVMAGSSEPVSQGFVASLAKPAGNITGIGNQGDEVLAKQIQFLHELAPAARRIAVLMNEANPAHALLRAAAQRACAELGVAAVWVAASAPVELAGAVEQIVSQRVQAVVVVADPLYFHERVRLQGLMHKTRLPVAYGQREHVVAGGLLSYASSFAANFRHVAKFVDRILKGAKPADLPIEQPTKFELVVNQKTAKALGLTIPQSLLLRADEVIE